MTSPLTGLEDPDDAQQRLYYTVHIEEGLIETPEQPEPLSILRRLRRFQLSYQSGGYADQPHILNRELNAVIDVELEVENIRLVNEASMLMRKQRELAKKHGQ